MKNDLSDLRSAIDSDRARLCDALGLEQDGSRYLCPKCQHDGAKHADGDFSIEAGFKCHKCGFSCDGFELVKQVKHCAFPEAVAFVREIYEIATVRPTARPTGIRKGATVHKTLGDAATACACGISKKQGSPWHVTRKDVYRDAAGVEIAAVLRLDGVDAEGVAAKTYRPYHTVTDGWQSGDPSGLWPMFNLEEIAGADMVFAPEGEKAVSAGGEIGLTCTTSAHGAQSPAKTDWAPVKGKKIVIFPDNDEAGRGYSVTVARLCLKAGAAWVKIIHLPNLPAKGDLREFVDAGGTKADIEKLVAETEPFEINANDDQAEAEPLKADASTVPTIESVASVETVETLRASLWELSTEKISGNEFNRKAADTVVSWLHGRGQFYYHVEHRDFSSVLFFDNKRKLLLLVQGDAFLAWLAECMGVNRSERIFIFAASAVETEGLSDRSKGIEPACFWAAKRDGDRMKAVYISSGPGQMVRITAKKVELVDNGADEVLFPAGAVLEPWHLVEERDPFEACTVFNNMSSAAPHGLDLLRLWSTTLFADLPCKPPLCVSSAVGGGKTVLVRAVFHLLGMPENINAVGKNDDEDFWVTLDGGGLVCFDNVDTRIDWLPDALAAAATAGSHQKRKKYTDSDRVTLRARAAVAVTSANPSFASDAGLADRLLVIRLERRKGETSESSLFNEVTAVRDAGLSWIAATLSRALADTAPTPPRLNARHPDFASFAVRTGRAMGKESEAVAALRAAEADKSLFNIENDDIGEALIELLRNERFSGTASALLSKLIETDSSFNGRLSSKGLGKRLSKLWPHLEALLKAKKWRGRGGYIEYSFEPIASGEFGEFKSKISKNSLCDSLTGTLQENPSETHQTHQAGSADTALNEINHAGVPQARPWSAQN